MQAKHYILTIWFMINNAVLSHKNSEKSLKAFEAGLC